MLFGTLFFFFTAKGRGKKILIRELNFNVAIRDNAFNSTDYTNRHTGY